MKVRERVAPYLGVALYVLTYRLVSILPCINAAEVLPYLKAIIVILIYAGITHHTDLRKKKKGRRIRNSGLYRLAIT